MKVPGNATVLAKHPAFFDAEKKLLAEVLPGGIYRFTKQGRGAQPVSLVVSPFAGEAFMMEESAKQYYVPFLGVAFDHVMGDFFGEGKKLLEKNGYRVEAEEEDMERLDSLVRRLRQQTPIQPEQIRPNDCAAKIFEDGGYKAVSVFQLAQGASGSEIRDGDMAHVEFFHDWNVHHKAVGRGRHTPWREMLKDLNARDWVVRSFVRIPAEDHEWLKKAAFFYQGEASPEEGKKIFKKLLWLKDVHEIGWNKNRQYRYKPDKDLTGNVAI